MAEANAPSTDNSHPTMPPVDPRLIFPHCERPARRYAGVRLPPLPEDDPEPQNPDLPASYCHRRIMRLLPKAPSIAIFPFIIHPIDKKAIKLSRGKHIKRRGHQYYFTLASFINWELGERKLRMGVAISFNQEVLNAPLHAWVVLVWIRSKGVNDIVIFDNTAEDLISHHNGKISLQKIHKAQRDLKTKLEEKHGIARVWWGGSTSMVTTRSGDTLCMLSSLLFMEKIAQEVESNGGLDEAILQRWNLRVLS